MSTARSLRPRAWSTTDFPVAGFFWFVGLLWLALFAVDLAITAGVAIWGEIDNSVWEQLGEIVRFFALGITAWLVHTYLPVYVAHGVTRREFMQKLTVFVVALSTLLGVLAAVGFLLERLLYELADWPQDLVDEHVFGSATEIPTVLVAYVLAYLVWAAVGAIVGAAIHRHDDGWGLVVLPVCILLLVASGYVVSSANPPFMEQLFDDRADSLAVAIVVCLLSTAAGLGVAWALIREIPIRNKTT